MITETQHTKIEKPFVPQLRFKEFNGDWMEKRTKEIAPLQRGFDLPTTQVIEGDYPVVYSNGILRKHFEYKVKGPGIVTGRSGTIGKVTYVEDDFWPHNTSLWVTNFHENDPKFIYYFYDCFNLSNYNAGSTVPTLNRNDVHSVKKYIPTLPEQQKIASFLTAVDTKLQQLTNKKELLQQYKKGVMQQLFSQQLRFKQPDGSDYPDWTTVKLGKVCEFTQGIQIPNSEQINEKKDGYIRYLYIRDFFMNSFPCYVKDIYKNKIILEDEIMMVNTGNTAGKAFKGATGVLSNNCFKITFNRKFINSDYLFSVLTGDFTQNQIKRFFNSGGQPHLGHKNIAMVPFSYPCFEEQQHIASYLSALDTKIETLTQQIENTQQFKKGLLQQMFV